VSRRDADFIRSELLRGAAKAQEQVDLHLSPAECAWLSAAVALAEAVDVLELAMTGQRRFGRADREYEAALTAYRAARGGEGG